MKSLKNLIDGTGIVVAATLGAGIFALPYTFKNAGWLTGIVYLIFLGGAVVYAHFIYWQTLAATKEKKSLLGLARTLFGKIGFNMGLLSIVFGLILALVVYLVLGAGFLKIIFPFLGTKTALTLFWLLISLPLLQKIRRLLNLEAWAVFFVSAIILWIFFDALGKSIILPPSVNLDNLFLAFGPVLFALAGWTAIEPLYEQRERLGIKNRPLLILFLGTGFAALLYILFVFGIFSSVGSANIITPDTLSGLSWPTWKLTLLSTLGILAIWTSNELISLEIENSLKSGLQWNAASSLVFVLLVPITLVILGLNNFLRVLGLVGGVFLSLQYLLILLVGGRVLRFGGLKKFFVNFISLIFVAAAVYEVYYFIVK